MSIEVRNIQKTFGNFRALIPRGGGNPPQGVAIGPRVQHQRHAGRGEGAGGGRTNAAGCPGNQNASCCHASAPFLFGGRISQSGGIASPACPPHPAPQSLIQGNAR